MSERLLREQQELLNKVSAEVGLKTQVDVQRFDNVVAIAEQAFAKFPTKPAFTSLGRTLTFADLDKLSRNFAAWLQHCTDLEPGDRIAVQMPNLIQYPVVVFGAMRAGLVIVNTNPLYSEREVEHQFNDAGVKALVVQANVAETTAKVLPRTGVKYTLVTELADLHSPVKRFLINNVAKYIKKIVPPYDIPDAISLNQALAEGAKHRYEPVHQMADTLAMLQYTGGTTGVAKGAMLSQGNLVANVLQVDELLETHSLTKEGQVVVQPLPVYHIYAFMTCVFSILNGSHMVFVPNARDIPSVVAALREYQPTTFCGLNTLFVALCNNEEFRQLDFSKLQVTLSGGMALSHNAAQRWQDITGCEVAEGYGLTETSPVVSSNPGTRKIIGTIGIPVSNTLVKIVDDEGQVQPLDEPGELCVKGPQVMQGYWQSPEETAKVIDADGYFHTGDIAKIRQDGFLQIVDRKKDMIVVSGFNVYPNELEDVLYAHEDVLECAAVGVPDATSGEVVKMFVVSKSGKLTAEEVRDFCRQSLTAYKVPKLVEFRKELPKSNVGKILRRELRDNS
ncbi:AMP-binding protein [Parahaliea sp. F7430]|uniref:Long-chain-fatty-acid--CoA ligase n=1 Tax=Sediminihaliea albiluteola TaxID=2758564 RepID=A0A7W2TU51_9GAMM|nr:AMP-binding protein [Sediminihaliea albiluteola]MBA6411928.1 AMP-binding protein [Sediminihaliea albiluteola]